jgi:DNA-binding transcriptional LysR family regulator
VEGVLTVATVLSVGIHELPIYVNRFRAQFPEVDLRIEYRKSAQVYSEVIDRRADLGLVAYPRRRKGIVIHSFWRDRLVLICPNGHTLSTRMSVRLTNLQGVDVVGFEPDLPTQKAIDGMFQRAKVEVHQKMQFDNVDMVKKAVELGTGVAIVPMRAVHKEVEAGRLKALMLNEPDCWRPLGILGKRNRAVTPAMRKFMEILTHGRHASSAISQPLVADPA